MFRVGSTHRVHEIALGPELSAPELLFDLGYAFEYLSCSDAFHYLCDLLRSVHGYRLYEEMHMVFVCADFKKMYFVPFGDLQAGRFDAVVHYLVEYYSTVFCRADQVIQKDSDVVAFMQVYAHRFTLAP